MRRCDAPINHLFAYANSNPLSSIDPLGRYSLLPLLTDKSAAVHNAMREIVEKLAGKPCCAGDSGDEVMSVLTKPSLVVVVSPTLPLCGEADSFTGVITLGPAAFTPACCSLASTLLHELTQLAGYGNEYQPYANELDCFGCKPPGIWPSPGPFEH